MLHRMVALVDGAGYRLRRNDKAMSIVINWLKSQLL